MCLYSSSIYCVGAEYPSAGQFGGPSGSMAFPGQQLLNDPMANMAVQYGQTLAGHGTEYVNRNVSSFLLFIFIQLFVFFYILFRSSKLNFQTGAV